MSNTRWTTRDGFVDKYGDRWNEFLNDEFQAWLRRGLIPRELMVLDKTLFGLDVIIRFKRHRRRHTFKT